MIPPPRPSGKIEEEENCRNRIRNAASGVQQRAATQKEATRGWRVDVGVARVMRWEHKQGGGRGWGGGGGPVAS